MINMMQDKATKSPHLCFVMCIMLIINTLTIKADIWDVRITEVMYNPPDIGMVLGNEYEFLELKNVGSTSVNLSGVSIGGGIQYTFPIGFTIAPGGFSVIVSNQAQFAAKYGAVTVTGQYTGYLGNSGDAVYLINGVDTVLQLNYGDDVPWPVLADGNGFSIVPVNINPSSPQDDSDHWMTSNNIAGSPGADDPAPQNFPDVYVNELLSSSEFPDLDKIELYNGSSQSVNIGGWYITDDRNIPDKYIIPASTNIPAGGYMVFDENEFATGNVPFRFNRSGEGVYLFGVSAGTLNGFATGWTFRGQHPGVSFGVHHNSMGNRHFVAMQTQTFGASNALPVVGPLIFSGICYNPDAANEEFIKVKNISGSTINLSHNQYSDTTWRISGVRFSFSPNVVIQPSEEIWITNYNPIMFRIKYGLTASNQIFQCTGNLNNDGERITLYQPGYLDTANTGGLFIADIQVESVRFNDAVPWPVLSDGAGYYLTRINEGEYGDEPLNWTENVVPLYVNETQAEGNLHVYPNPTTGNVYFNQLSLNAKLFSGSGQEILTVKSKTQIDLSPFPSGIYYLLSKKKSIQVIKH